VHSDIKSAQIQRGEVLHRGRTFLAASSASMWRSSADMVTTSPAAAAAALRVACSSCCAASCFCVGGVQGSRSSYTGFQATRLSNSLRCVGVLYSMTQPLVEGISLVLGAAELCLVPQ
jgi:hypothetical protein